MKAVLVDSGPLYALADPDDEWHDRAGGELFLLEDRRLQLVVPWPVLLEAYTLVLRRLGLKKAHSWLTETVAGTAQISPRRQDYEDAADRIRRLRDQEITLFDGLLASLGSYLDLPVWTFDHHLDVLGAQVWR